MAFNQQIKRLNLKANRKIELRPEIEELDATDSFAVSNAICALLKKGVYGIIGMSNASALSTIQSYSNTFQVPFIALGMAQNTSNHGPYQLFMRPLYTEGLLDVILEYKWDHILYVYDTDEGLIRLQQLFQVVNIRETTIDIDVKRVSDPYACFDMLKNLTKKFEKRLHRVLLDMSTEKAADVILKIINSSDVPNDKFHFLLGELRIEEMKYHSFSKGGMNITGFQLLNSTDLKKSNEHEMLLWDWPDETITLEAAMVIDAVNLFKRALNQLETRRGKQPNRYPINVNFRQNVKCTDSTYVSPLKGTNMTEILKSVEFDGLTGKVNFDERGFRDKFTLYLEDIIISRRLSHVGSWSRSRRLNLHEPIIWRQRQSNESRPRNITTILEAPYVMYKDKETEERKPTCGVENFIGFCIDLLLAVVKELDLDYELCIVGDGSFGTQLENGTWNGMIGELVRQEKPYMMYKDPVHDADRENAPKCGKQYFEGFCAELAQKVADLVGFEYELCLVGDGVYGEKLENGTWSGIIGELTREEKDLAVAPITITSTRERVVDFTKPYLSLGISIIIKKTSVKKASVFSFMDPLSYEIWMCILFAYIGVSVVLFLVSRFSIKKTSVKKASVFSFMDPLSYEIWMCILFAYIGVSVVLFLVSRFSIKKTSVKKASVFSFMDPLSYEIWMCILFAYIGVSVVLFLVSRFSPTEWHIEDGSNITNDFTISNSLWYSLGAFMQQGCDISPRSVSGRIVGSVWWFFTLIIISSYTANLAAFLTVERMLTPIESAEDLAKQTEIQYGTLQAGSTKDFFQYSKFPVYERMWAYMQSASPSVLVKNTDEGIRRVRNENYAYLIESTTNDYINMRKPCDTMKVGTNLDSKGYGIATPIGSDLRDKLTLAVLMLREAGDLEEMQKKWWDSRDKLTLAVLKLREAGDLEEMQKKWWDSRSECPPPSNSQDGGQQELTLSNVAGIFYILVAGLLLSVIIACLEFLYKSKLDSKRSKKSFGSVLRCKARLSFRGSLDRDTPASSTPLRKSMSTYTYTGPTQMVGNDGIPDNTHTQV